MSDWPSTLDPVVLQLGPLVARVRAAGAVRTGRRHLAHAAWRVWRSLRELDGAAARQVALDALAWATPGRAAVRPGWSHVLGWWDYYLTHAAELWQLSSMGCRCGVACLAVGPGLRPAAVLQARSGAAAAHLRRRGARRCARHRHRTRWARFSTGTARACRPTCRGRRSTRVRLAATPDFGVTRHPAQLYDALVALALFVAAEQPARGWPAGSRHGGVLRAVRRCARGAGRGAAGPVVSVRAADRAAPGPGRHRRSARGTACDRCWLQGARARTRPPEQPARTGRLAGRMNVRATLYMKPGCHLCEATLDDSGGCGRATRTTLELVDITTARRAHAAVRRAHPCPAGRRAASMRAAGARGSRAGLAARRRSRR